MCQGASLAHWYQPLCNIMEYNGLQRLGRSGPEGGRRDGTVLLKVHKRLYILQMRDRDFSLDSTRALYHPSLSVSGMLGNVTPVS